MTEKNAVPVLSILHLNKHLGKRKVLDDITLDVYPGEVFGFLGPNGAGKTTTIKLMLGLLRMEDGEIRICGHSISKEFEAAVANIGGIVENPELYKYLTGRQNLEVFARMQDNIPPERIDEVVALVGLSDRIRDKVSTYSLGMRQRLGLAQALINRPKLLVLDEPTNGLDPAGIKDLRDTLTRLAHEEGTSVFISSHQLAELDQICDRISIISKGKLIETLTIEEVRNAGSGNGSVFTLSLDEATLKNIPADTLAKMKKLSGTDFQMQMPREQMPECIASLCAAGVRLYSVAEKRYSLEEVFLSVLCEDTAAQAPAAGAKDRESEVKPE